MQIRYEHDNDDGRMHTKWKFVWRARTFTKNLLSMHFMYCTTALVYGLEIYNNNNNKWNMININFQFTFYFHHHDQQAKKWVLLLFVWVVVMVWMDTHVHELIQSPLRTPQKRCRWWWYPYITKPPLVCWWKEYFKCGWLSGYLHKWSDRILCSFDGDACIYIPRWESE